MPSWLSPEQYAVVESAVDRLIPPDDDGAPGGRAAGAADYIDGLLGAFLVDPPRIWAGGPFSGRHGGDPGFDGFLPLGRVEERAWRTRVEGSQGRPDRELNGPVVGFQQLYAEGLARLGEDFADVGPETQDARLTADPVFQRLLYVHACEGTYGDPVYGGNRRGVGWASVGFAGDSQPRGWTDGEVARRG